MQRNSFAAIIDFFSRLKMPKSNFEINIECIKDMMDDIDDLVFIKDTEFRYIYINKAFCEIIGKDREEIIGKTDKEFYTEKEYTFFEKTDLQVLNSKEEFTFVEKVSTKNGKSWGQARKSPIFDKNNNVIGIKGYVKIIDLHKQQENELLIANNFSASIIETAQVLIITLDNNGIIQTFNSFAEKITNYQKSNIIGKSISPLLVVDDFLQKAINSENLENYESPIRTSLSAQKIISWSKSNIVIENEKIGILLIGNDITQQHFYQLNLIESQRKYKSIYENILDVYIETSLDGEILEISDNISRISDGVYTSSKLIGTKIQDLYFFEHDRENFLDLLNKNGKIEDFQIEFKKGDGTKSYCSISAKIQSLNGQPRIIAGTIRDISERIKNEKLMKKHEAKYRMLFNNMQEGFSYHKMICDENGNPIDFIFLDTNDAYTRNIGLNAKEVIGKKLSELVPEANHEHVEIFNSVAQTGIPKNFEFFSKPLNRYLTVKAFSPEKGYFATIFEDVTEKKLKEKSLEESERRFRGIIENTEVAYFFIDKDGIFRDVNNAWLKLYKFETREQVIGLHLTVVQKIEDKELAKEFFEGILQNNPIYTKGEFSRKCADNSIAYHIFCAQAVQKNNETIGIEGFLIDTTEKIISEKALLESNNRFKYVLENLKNIAVQAYSIDGTVSFWNKTSEEFYGFTESEMIGNNLMQKLYSDEKTRQNEFNVLNNILQTGVLPAAEEIEITKKDLSTITVLASRIMIKSENSEPEFFCFDIDVTAIKKAEQELILNERRLSLALTATSDAIWDWNYITNKTYYSKRWYEILGYDDQEFEMNFDTWKSLCHPDDYQHAIKQIDESLKSKKGEGYSTEFRMKHKLGHWVWILGRGNVVERDEFNNPLLLSGTNSDITEKKIAEQQLIESKIEFQNLVEQIPVGVYKLRSNANLDMKFEFVSKKFCQFMGVDEEGIYYDASLCFSSIMPSDLDNLLELNSEAIRNNTPFLWEGRVIIQGKIDWYRIQSHPSIINKDFTIWNGTVSQITNLKLAEKTIKDNEKKFRAIFENAPYSITMTNLENGAFIAVNEAFLNESKRSEIDVIGKTAYELGMVGNKNSHTDNLNALKNTGKITNQIMSVIDRNNETAYIMFSSSLVKLDNVPCALTVSINITQQIVAEQKLKESEERYRLMAENTADTIMLMDMDMRFTYVSPSVLNLRGISAENVLKQSIHEIMPPESAHKLMRTFFEIQRIAKMDTPNSPKVYNLELEQYKFDGSTIWTELSLTLIRDEEYQPISILMVTRDISSRKFAEDEVIKLNKELELKVEERTLELKKTLEQLQESNYELNLLNSQVIEDSRRIIYLNEDLMNSQELLNQAIASKDRFFSIIAHDLRNPFVVLINNSDMLINHYDKMDDEKKLVMIKRISEASKFNYSLLENLLEWSRNQMGNIQYNPSMVNLSEIVSKTTNILQSFAMNKNITMNININNEYFAHCDSDILNTVLRNLISNAIKFSNENSSIEIKAQVYVQNTDFIKISIKDNGVGMSDEQIKNLFKLESNKSSVGTKNEKGSGLGLILCHDFVTMNKGHIWVESEENKGSTFFFTIPKAH